MAGHLSEAEKQNIRDLYSLGISRSNIKNQLGVSFEAIARAIGTRRDDIGRHKNPKCKATPATIEEMRTWRELGLSNKQIAKEMGLCYDTVLRAIGPQPTGIKAGYGEVVSYTKGSNDTLKAAYKPAPKEKKEEPPMEKPASPFQILAVQIKGQKLRYKINQDQIILCSDNGENLTLGKQDFAVFANEIANIQANLSQGKLPI